MSSIIAPPYPFAPFGIGEGVRGANGYNVNIFGAPLPNDGDLGISNTTSPLTIISPKTLFDASTLSPNHEIVCIAFLGNPTGVYSATTITINWYRLRDGAHAFPGLNHTWIDPNIAAGYPPGSGYYYDVNTLSYAAWIGWLADDLQGVPTFPEYREIQENGNYLAVVSITGGYASSQFVEFAVKGIPAKTVLENATPYGFDWTVRLTNYFETSNYIRAGICTEPFTDGQNYAPDGIIASKSAPSSSPGCAAVGTVTSLEPGTLYTVYGFAQAANGLYYQTGSATIRTAGRPSLFAWQYSSIASGATAEVDARDWNALTAKINAFREYVGKDYYWFTTIYPGGDIYAWQFNQLVDSLANDDGYWTYPQMTTYMFDDKVPGQQNTGDDFKAEYLQKIVSSLNSIP